MTRIFTVYWSLGQRQGVEVVKASTSTQAWRQVLSMFKPSEQPKVVLQKINMQVKK